MQQGDSLFSVPTCSLVSPWNFVIDGTGIALLMLRNEFVSPSSKEVIYDHQLPY